MDAVTAAQMIQTARDALEIAFGKDKVVAFSVKTNTNSVQIGVEILDKVGADADANLRKDFDTYGRRFGLSASDVDRGIIYKGAKFKIIGIDPTARKAPIIAIDGDRRIKFPVGYLGLKTAASPIVPSVKPSYNPITGALQDIERLNAQTANILPATPPRFLEPEPEPDFVLPTGPMVFADDDDAW